MSISIMRKDFNTKEIIQEFLVEENFMPHVESPKKAKKLKTNLVFISITHLIKKLSKIPYFYRNTGIITWILGILGVVFTFVDVCFNITNLNITPHIMWCFSCASLYYTNKIALKEWMRKNGKKYGNKRKGNNKWCAE